MYAKYNNVAVDSFERVHFSAKGGITLVTLKQQQLKENLWKGVRQMSLAPHSHNPKQ